MQVLKAHCLLKEVEDPRSCVAKSSQYMEYGFTLGRLGSGALRQPQVVNSNFLRKWFEYVIYKTIKSVENLNLKLNTFNFKLVSTINASKDAILRLTDIMNT